MAKAKCIYEECKLPKNNNHYFWQIGYMLIGLGVLFFSAKDFTFFQTFLFIAPVALDIFNAGFTTKTVNVLRVCFGVLDAALLVGCFLGMLGVIKDVETEFMISKTFLYWPGVAIEKKIVGYVIALNLIVPIVFYIGSPCQDTQNIMNRVKALKKEGVGQE